MVGQGTFVRFPDSSLAVHPSRGRFTDREEIIMSCPICSTLPQWSPFPCPLDGSTRYAVRLLTGYTDRELDELGGFEGEAQ